MGTWRTLKKELTEPPQKELTIYEYAQVYFQEHCCIRNTRPDFEKESLEVIKRIVGRITSSSACVMVRPN
jgi:hypothetical protein